MLYRRITIVEARQYSGPRLVVVNDEIGEQVAVAGDYLLGCERGKLIAMTAEKFKREGFEPYTPDAEAV